MTVPEHSSSSMTNAVVGAPLVERRKGEKESMHMNTKVQQPRGAALFFKAHAIPVVSYYPPP